MELDEITLVTQVPLHKEDALIVVDMQHDFLPGGALAVEEGDSIIDGINELIALFHQVDLPIIFTQDWHPKNHASFASQHQGKQPFDPIEDPTGCIGPVLWPDHCIQGTKGADFHDAMDFIKATTVIRKGYHVNIDSYSTFLENDRMTPTGLSGLLKEKLVTRVFICGLALDYCVNNSVMDARDLGFDVMLVLDLTKPVGSPEGIVQDALESMVSASVQFTNRQFIKML